MTDSEISEQNCCTLPQGRESRVFILILLGYFFVLLLKTAWLGDDAFITFRTVENFVLGHGLRWNVAERVQCYTHPLWAFMLSGVRFITGNLHWSSLALSVVLSLAAVSLFAFGIARNGLAAVLGISVLCFSKAFVDYSTSGLENCMTHFLLALFLIVYFSDMPKRRQLLYCSFLSALLVLNRMDVLLIVLPALLFLLFCYRKPRGVFLVIVGFLPFVLWEIFSLFYYGFLFPNTAYAKLSTGIPKAELIRQGVVYFIDLVEWDPLTLFFLLCACLAPVMVRSLRVCCISCGIFLYLAYIVVIGGDFMSGRFFSAPLFFSVALVFSAGRIGERLSHALLLVLIGLLYLITPNPTIISRSVDADGSWRPRPSGITDERAAYHYWTGLVNYTRHSKRILAFDWVKQGVALRDRGPRVVVKGAAGMVGYYAGSDIHIVDQFCLCDPLLSRLPMATSDWRVGHYERIIPVGYLETLQSGENKIEDQQLSQMYDKLALITRGPLLSTERLKEIVRFNLN